MILITTPSVRSEKWGESAQILSDLPGDPGYTELAKFAYLLGLNPQWVRCPGTYKEHFNVLGRFLVRARVAGAEVAHPTRIAEALRVKKYFLTK
jgi:hypothetical protein